MSWNPNNMWGLGFCITGNFCLLQDNEAVIIVHLNWPTSNWKQHCCDLFPSFVQKKKEEKIKQWMYQFYFWEQRQQFLSMFFPSIIYVSVFSGYCILKWGLMFCWKNKRADGFGMRLGCSLISPQVSLPCLYKGLQIVEHDLLFFWGVFWWAYWWKLETASK